MNASKMICALLLSCVVALAPLWVFAGGVSVCEIGVSTPAAAAVICAASASTVYGVEFSSNVNNLNQTWVEVYNTSVVAGTVDTAKLMTGTLDTAKAATHPVVRNASAGVVIRRNNDTIPFKVLLTTP